jgi:hypothetical protein
MKRGLGIEILKQVQAVVLKWKEFADTAGVPADTARKIAATHRTSILA